MKKSALVKSNLERSLKWEKAKVEKAVNQLIYENAENLVGELIDIGLTDRNPNAINSLLDRGFGKAAQLVNHGGQVDNPIVFMPAVLLEKYKLEATKVHDQLPE